MAKKQQFIVTMDADVASILSKQGFTLLSNKDKYMFLNDATLVFEEDKDHEMLSKMVYTNVLCMTE